MSPSRGGWVLLAVTALVFAPTLDAGFVWDDTPLIVKNPLITGPGGVADHFRQDLWEPTPAWEGATGYYRPLFTLGLALDHALVGLSPGLYHFVSVAWHLVAVHLLHGLLRKGGATEAGALVGAGLYALHPAQVETVAFISARSETLAAAGLFGVLHLLGGEERVTPARVLGGGLLALAAMLCKETALTAPLVLAVWVLGQGRRPRLVTLAGPALAVVAWYLLRRAAGVELPANASVARFMETSGPALVLYAKTLLAPWPLIPGTHLDWPPPIPWALGGLAAGVLLALGGLARRAGAAGLTLAGLWLLPSLGAVAAVGLVSDRYLHLPLAGLGLVVAAVVDRCPLPWRALAVALPLVLGVTSFATLPPWHDDLRFWYTATLHHPQPYTWTGMAKVLELAGRHDAAADWYRRATQPPKPRQQACFNLTSLQLQRGDPAGAVSEGERGLAAGCAPSPELLAPLALAYAAVGRWGEAEVTAMEVDADPTGKAVVVRVAAAARRGDLEPLRAAGGTRVGELAAQVVWLLEQAGEQEAAAAVRAAVR